MASSASAFGISNFKADVFAYPAGATVDTQAGSTPYTGVTDFTFDTSGTPNQQAKRIRVDLPAGLISNPQATPQCPQDAFTAGTCNANTQIGKVDITALG